MNDTLTHMIEKALERFPWKIDQIKILSRRTEEGDKMAWDCLYNLSQGFENGVFQPRYSGTGMYS